MSRLIYRIIRISALTALFFIYTLPVHASQQQTWDYERALENALVCGISMGIPGISAAVGIGDRVVWTGTAGYSDISRRVPVKVHDRFGIGSITKTFVARVILQLVEEGRLDLNKTPTDYLDLEIVRRVPNMDKATLRECLNHHGSSSLIGSVKDAAIKWSWGVFGERRKHSSM